MSTIPDIPLVNIIGIPVHAFTRRTLHDYIAETIRNRGKAIVANVNVHAMNLAHDLPWFADFLTNSDAVFCDGHGVMVAAWLIGQRVPEKITYADWVPQLAEFCQHEQFALFLLGGRPGVARKAADRLQTLYPLLRIAGQHDGYFDKTQGSPENQSVIRTINASGAHILLVCFGMPLQEQWLKENWQQLQVHVALTGGAALDYVSGCLKRPPLWMTRHGLEWFGRLLIEPKRLWRRYLIGTPLFFVRLVKHQWGRKARVS